jgi:hypothetical protein
VAGFIPIVALIVEHVVAERVSKLRNVLTVMGCDLKTYWLGTLVRKNKGDWCGGGQVWWWVMCV